jgi:glyoxylase-like metal-dependent hydrolase (beta-lactamase superfamily II)
MAVTQIVPGLWQIGLGIVNAFLIEEGGALTLIDTGVPSSDGKIMKAIADIARRAAGVKRIVVTHCHPDHAGSVASLKRLTGASVMMHPVDAEMVRRGQAKRPMTPAPGLRRRILYRLFVAPAPSTIEAAEIDVELIDGADVPGVRGLRVIHAPGHCAGQIVLLWTARRVLIVGDAAANIMGLGLSLGYEDLARGVRTLTSLAALDFDVACFGHGGPIKSDAARQFRRKWPAAAASPAA